MAAYLCRVFFVFFQLQKREINDKGGICVMRDATQEGDSLVIIREEA